VERKIVLSSSLVCSVRFAGVYVVHEIEISSTFEVTTLWRYRSLIIIIIIVVVVVLLVLGHIERIDADYCDRWSRRLSVCQYVCMSRRLAV